MPDRPGLQMPPPKEYKVAIFDFDGTLLDSVLIYPFIHKEVLRVFGIPDSDLDYLTLAFWYDTFFESDEHPDAPAFFLARHGLNGQYDGLDFRRVRNHVEEEYFSGERKIRELGPVTKYVNKPVVADLYRLHDAGAECYIVSNNYGRMIEAALRSLGLEDMFADCYTHCAYDELRHRVYDKCQPKQESYQQLVKRARELGGDASDCVVYDDLRKYVEQARELEMDAVWVDNEHAVPRSR